MPGKRPQATYLPGKCNIGEMEVSRRYRIGFLGMLMTAVLILAIEWSGISHSWRLAVVIPVAVMLSGFVQAAGRFCMLYGLHGAYSMYTVQAVEKVTDPVARKADRRKALVFIGMILAASMGFTAMYYVLP